jgi:hypothetical protein
LANIAPPWLLSTNGSIVVIRNSSLAVSGSGLLTLTVVPQTVGTITNRVSVTSGYPDFAMGDNTASIATVVEPFCR